jgi:uncharacterized membrane protein
VTSGLLRRFSPFTAKVEPDLQPPLATAVFAGVAKTRDFECQCNTYLGLATIAAATAACVRAVGCIVPLIMPTLSLRN